jgi:VWFA-related protein
MSQNRHNAIFLIAIALLTTALYAQDAAPQQSNLTGTPSAADPAAHPAAPAVPVAKAPHFVPVLISATDSHGGPVLGLTKEQITILDTNQDVQPLQLYKGTDLPLHLGIVLLCSPRTFSQQQAAAIDLVNKVIRPGIDGAFVVSARGKKAWPGKRLEWKQDSAELSKIIKSLDPEAGLQDPFDFDLATTQGGFGSRMNIQKTFEGGGGIVFDVVYAMMNSDPRPSRRVLFMFREAWSHSPGFGERANTWVEDHMLQVIAAAQKMHISTFVIGLEDPQYNRITDTDLGTSYNPTHAGEGAASRSYDSHMQQARIRAYEAGRTNIVRLATETGGAIYWSTKKNYSDAISSMANELSGQYILTFIPKNAPTEIHPLKVIGKDGTHVRAQAAFFAATQ